MIPRSWLFCPGNRTDRLGKALGLADVAVADLEDAVPVEKKPAARETVLATLDADQRSAQRIWVRINNDTEHIDADLNAFGEASVGGLVVPKAEPRVMRRIAEATNLPLLALVETAEGLWQARQLTETPCLYSLTLGEYDLAAELNVSQPDVDPRPLHWARSRIVAAAASAHGPPPAPVSTVVGDEASYRKDTTEIAQFGFFGRLCIHPSQVGPTHEVVTPSDAEVAEARAVLQAAEQAEQEGSGVVVIDGKMIDPPIVRKARRVLELVQRS